MFRGEMKLGSAKDSACLVPRKRMGAKFVVAAPIVVPAKAGTHEHRPRARERRAKPAHEMRGLIVRY